MANRYTLNVKYVGYWLYLYFIFNIKIKARELTKLNSTLPRHQMSNTKRHSPRRRILHFSATIGCQKTHKVIIL